MAGARSGQRGWRAGGGLARLAPFAPFLLWAVVWIGLLGGESFASRHTVGWVGRLLPFLPAGWLPAADFALRKVLHFLAYGFLGWLAGREALARFPRGEAPGERAGRLAGVGALLMAVALLDEGHQRLVRGRHPSPVDVLIDAAGAGAGLFLAGVRSRGRAGPRAPAQSG